MNLPIPNQLETSRLRLLRFKHEDAEEIFYAYASKPEVTKYLSWPTHKSIHDTQDFLSYTIHAWDAGTDYSFAVRLKESNRLIGGCGMIHDDGKIQFGYVLSPTHWGQGFATELTRRLMETVRNCQDVYRVGTLVDCENLASAKVLLKSGLVEEARLEKWIRFVNQDNRPKDCILFRLPLNR